jgi:RNA polymerase sigma-70 factor, ECF subfamily
LALEERLKLNRRLWRALRREQAEEAGNETVADDLAASPSEEAPAGDAAETLLVQQARQDPKAFGALYELYVDRIYAYIFHRVGNADDAEDLTARTFYRALDRFDTYEDRGLPFSAWLFRIAHNLVANWYRERHRRPLLSLDRLWTHSESQASPEHQVEQEERQAALWAAINRLPEERRNLLLLKFGSQMSNVEIGDLLRKSESAVKSLYFRTLATLRKDMEAHGWSDVSELVEEAEPEDDGPA